MILCRYTTSERCIELIKDQRLYAANPVVDFNDPFEFCLGTVGEINREGLDRYYRNDLRPRLSSDLQKKLPEDLTNEAWETLKPTYKQKRKQDNEESIKDAVEKTIRIICFCDPDKIKNGGEDILLWSHYANGHKGVKIYFNTEHIKTISENLFPVFYSEERPGIDITDPNHENAEEVCRSIIQTKNKSWHYEQESRWIIHRDECIKENGRMYIPFLPEAIRRIDLGCRCNKREDIMAVLKENKAYKHVKMYDALVHEHKFALEYKEIELDNL